MRGFPLLVRRSARTLRTALLAATALLFILPGIAQAAKITELLPSTVTDVGDEVVNIFGEDLDDVSEVTIDGIVVPIEDFNADDQVITVIAPPHAPGVVQVRLRTPAGLTPDNGSADDLTYIPMPDPAIFTSITPNFGPRAGGNQVVIKGKNFSTVQGIVFGDTGLVTDWTLISDTEIRATVPAATADGKVNVIMFSAAGLSDGTGTGDEYTYGGSPPPVPTISSLNPKSGPSGTEVTITGTNLAGATVTFGGNDAGIKSTSATSVVAVAPPGTGTVDVIATTNGGPSANTANDNFTYTIPVKAPAVTGIAPNSGSTAGGTVVTITGTDLSGATGVKFGSASGTNLVQVSATELRVTAPAGSAGKVDVTVTTGGGTSANTAADDFTYVVPAPTVTGISPSTGTVAGGTVVTVTGTNLANATAVKFGSATGTNLTQVSATQVRATAPAGSAGKVDVTVTTAGGTSANTSADDFTYFVPAPVVSGISPSTGLTTGGTVVTINGQNLSGTTSVTFGGTAATAIDNVSSTQIKATAPAKAAGKVDVVVTTAGGPSANTSADDFTYVPPAPAVTGISPSTGLASGGTVVTITGTNLTGATAVKFGATNATNVTVDSATTIRATAPAGSIGKVDVSVTTAGGTSANTSADDFTYFVPAPSVSGIAPSTGSTAGGTVVTITGENLSGATAVKFGSANGTNLTQVSATQVRATAPAGSAGKVDVTVTTAGGTSDNTSADDFTYVVPAPTITGISPATGLPAGGTVVTITGTNLSGATGVKFGSADATNVTQVSATQVRATSPAGEVGKVDVSVTTAGGTTANTSADDFTYAAEEIKVPVVNSISPGSGAPAGGTVVTITGSNLAGATSVKFGANEATNLVQVSATQVKATAPAGTGTVDVTVTTAGGTSAVSTSARFTYQTPSLLIPRVVKITPNVGFAWIGGITTIRGENLKGIKSVKFGSRSATFWVSGNTILAIAPAQGKGTVNVSITNAFGTSLATSLSRYTYLGF